MKTLIALVVILSASPAIASAACKEGRMGSVPGIDHRGEHTDFPAVCRNGKYVRLDGYVAPKPVYRGCQEGRMGSVPGIDHRGEHTDFPAVCRNGKYVRIR